MANVGDKWGLSRGSTNQQTVPGTCGVQDRHLVPKRRKLIDNRALVPPPGLAFEAEMENSDMPAEFHVSETLVGIFSDNRKLLAVTLLMSTIAVDLRRLYTPAMTI